MKPNVIRFARAAAILLVAGICFFRLGSGYLTQTDEGFTANRALSILLHRTPLLTYDEPEGPQFQKPPLAYELVALAYELIGINLWAVRLPGAILSFLLCLLLVLISRHYFGEWIALASAVLFCATPFVALHIRTAMLEMPLLFMIFMAVWAFAFAPRSPWLALAAGLAVAGAVLTKGGAGLLALPPAIVLALVRHPNRRRTLLHVLILILATVLPVLIYDSLLPAEYRSTFVDRMFHNQHTGAIHAVHLSARWPMLYKPLLRHLGWHVPLALAGLVWLAARAFRRPALLEWALLFGLIAVPAVIGGLEMAHPFDRYFLPVYPFLITLSVWLVTESARDWRAALALLPAAASAPLIVPSAPGWIPAGLCVGVLLSHLPAVRQRLPARAATALAILALAAAALPLLFTGSTWTSWKLPPQQQAQPEIARLATQARSLIPDGQALMVSPDFKSHCATFYSRHHSQSYVDWLLFDFKPGDSRIAVLHTDELIGVPALTIDDLARDGAWKLARVTIAPNAAEQGIRCLALSSRATRRVTMRETFRLLDIQAVEFTSGFAVTRLPTRSTPTIRHANVSRILTVPDGHTMRPVPPSEPGIVIQPGDALDIPFSQAAVCSGVDVDLETKSDLLLGLTLQTFDDRGQEWLTLQTVNKPYHTRLTIADGRIQPDPTHRLRLRFHPVPVTRLRLANQSSAPLQTGPLHVYASTDKP